MRKVFLITLTMFLSFTSFAQREPWDDGRGGTEPGYEVIGLHDGDTVVNYLKIALPLLIIGFLISYLSMWSKKDTSQISDTESKVGCLGMIIMGVGVFFLIPLLGWVELIGKSLMSLGFFLMIIIGLIYIVYSAITKK